MCVYNRQSPKRACGLKAKREEISPIPSPTFSPSSPVLSYMAPYTPGCVFEYFGRIPEAAYSPTDFQSDLEKAVYENDVKLFNELVESGEEVSVRLKIGEMSCLEYAAMKGYFDLLKALLSHSVCAQVLHKYFQLEDVVERAYMISKDKSTFFGSSAALAEANRYLAALYTAVLYNQPKCVQLMLTHLGRRDLLRSSYFTTNGSNRELLTAAQLAQTLGHAECHRILTQCQESSNREIEM